MATQETVNVPEPWSDDDHRQWDKWVDGGVKTPEQATEEIERLHRLRAAGKTTSAEVDVVTVDNQPSSQEQPDILQPAPPRPGETDEQIRQRHRDALAARPSDTPANFDPELTRRMLDRARRGDFADPDQS